MSGTNTRGKRKSGGGETRLEDEDLVEDAADVVVPVEEQAEEVLFQQPLPVHLRAHVTFAMPMSIVLCRRYLAAELSLEEFRVGVEDAERARDELVVVGLEDDVEGSGDEVAVEALRNPLPCIREVLEPGLVATQCLCTPRQHSRRIDTGNKHRHRCRCRCRCRYRDNR